ENSIEKKIDDIQYKIDQIGNNLNQKSQGITDKSGRINILIFNVFLFISIVAGIIFTFVTKESPVRKDVSGIPFTYDRQAIRLINIYNIIEYQRMMPQILSSLKIAQEADHIKGIIIRINSGGGTVAASQEIYRSIREFRKRSNKPVIAVLGDVAASGAYYIASATDEIIVSKGTLTGSIGVIMTGFTFKSLFNKLGVKQEIVKNKEGKFKDIITAIGRDRTPEEVNVLQGLVDSTFKQFFNDVYVGRNEAFKNLYEKKLSKKKVLSKETLLEYADGRVFDGIKAVEIGLADRLGGLSEGIRRMKEHLGLKKDDKLILIEEEKSPFAKLFELLGSKTSFSIQDFLKTQSAGIPLYLYMGEIK
ncbi:MAG: signal peptide peptidase SppA, partial [Spirochaetota bacterium]|nr:signal peptide peptidase SppA [Spirochaetota bacterium]